MYWPEDMESASAIEETLNRLAVEAVLAAPGRDEGLIPSFSLLGELAERCAGEPDLRGPVAGLLPEFERTLDAGQPYTQGLLDGLRGLIAWMQAAIAARKAGLPIPPSGSGGVSAAPPAENPTGPSSPAAAPKTPAPADSLLEFELGDNRDLLAEFQAEAAEHLQQIEATLLVLDRNPADPEALNAIFRSFHTIKGNAGFLGLGPMNKLAHEVETLLDLARNRRLQFGPAVVTEVLRSRDALQALLQQVADALESGRKPDRIVPTAELILAVRALAAGEAPAAKPVAAEPSREAAPAPAGAVDANAQARSPASSQTVRVAAEKLDCLMDVVGELVIVQSQLMESAQRLGAEASSLQRDVGQLSRLTKDLQRTAMGLRMIPIKPAFQKMERLARDLARTSGKRIEFETAGGETELDRLVVEEIADPLVHMVRNAVDHGLEPPEDRVKAGKPEVGRVALRAYHQGGNVVVELQDDGRGIDPARVLDKARRQGLVAPDAKPSREEIFSLIFLPGFSTAEKVTAVSGRGVGMDVVRRNIERLRGRIEIASEVGKGSVFKIKLPLTLAIIDGLVVRVGGDRFVLPSTSVHMALRPEPGAVTRVRGTGEVFDWHGRLLPLHRLHRRFNLEPRASEPSDGIIIVIESSDKVCALLVDEMVSKQEVVIKSLGAFMQGLAGVSGGAILGDGNIALILDPASLLEAA